jgi:hypothetical protein
MKESTISKTLILGFEKPDFCNSGIMPTLLRKHNSIPGTPYLIKWLLLRNHVDEAN